MVTRIWKKKEKGESYGYLARIVPLKLPAAGLLVDGMRAPSLSRLSACLAGSPGTSLAMVEPILLNHIFNLPITVTTRMSKEQTLKHHSVKQSPN
jgi:hypothetical protein